MKIISGGQTGVDRAALDAAAALGLAYGGWCPKGGWAEDMPEPPGVLTRYPNLRPTPSADLAERTRRNVRDSDWTLVLIDARGPAASPGTMLTVNAAVEMGKPHITIDVDASDAPARLSRWLAGAPGELVLNVAGPRESQAPGIYAKARRLLESVLADA